MHCHSIYDDMYHSSGQLHQRFALRTLLVILGDQFTVSNMIDEKVTGMLLAAFMTWKSLLFWCSSSSLFQLYNCKFSVYRKKKICLVSGLQPEIQLSSAQLEAWVSLTQVDICPFCKFELHEN